MCICIKGLSLPQLPVACLTSLLPLPFLSWSCVFSFLITDLPSPFSLCLSLSHNLSPSSPQEPLPPGVFFLLSSFLSDSGSPLPLFTWFSKINTCGAASVNRGFESEVTERQTRGVTLTAPFCPALFSASLSSSSPSLLLGSPLSLPLFRPVEPILSCFVPGALLGVRGAGRQD